jgi:hypothetical protein
MPYLHWSDEREYLSMQRSLEAINGMELGVESSQVSRVSSYDPSLTRMESNTLMKREPSITSFKPSPSTKREVPHKIGKFYITPGFESPFIEEKAQEIREASQRRGLDGKGRWDRYIWEIDHNGLGIDERLLRSYVYDRRPMHLRRTLDRSYYKTLTDKDINARDKDQVVYRYTEKVMRLKYPRMIMVDQLWLWIIDES